MSATAAGTSCSPLGAKAHIRPAESPNTSGGKHTPLPADACLQVEPTAAGPDLSPGIAVLS